MPDPVVSFPYVPHSPWRILRAGCSSLTLVQPVCDAIKDDALLPRGREPPRAALNVCLVVNVVFKHVDLWNTAEIWLLDTVSRHVALDTKINLHTHTHTYTTFIHVCNQCE